MEKSVFIDSNVWFSAFYKEGVCSKILRRLVKSGWGIIISELVLEEIVNNLQSKIPRALPAAIEFIKQINVLVVKNPPPPLLKQYQGLAKSHDLAILVSAIENNCRYFLTGNKKDFNVSLIKKRVKIQVLSPAELMKAANLRRGLL